MGIRKMSITRIQLRSETIMPEELDKFINIRDSETHKQIYERKAEELGISRSDYLRAIIWKEHNFIPRDYIKIELNEITKKELKEKANNKNLSIEEYIQKLIIKDLHYVSHKSRSVPNPPRKVNPPRKTPAYSKPRRKANNSALPFLNEIKTQIQNGSKNGYFDPKAILNDMKKELAKEQKKTVREALLIQKIVKKLNSEVEIKC